MVKQKKNNEQGYILLETLGISLMLLAMTGCLLFYRQAAALRCADAARTTALYLAREEFSRLQWMEQNEESFSAFSVQPWLGSPDSLRQNGGIYRVRAETGSRDSTGMVSVVVVVQWEKSGFSGEQRFRRLIGRHGQESKRM